MQALHIQLGAPEAAAQAKPASKPGRQSGESFASVIESVRSERPAEGRGPDRALPAARKAAAEAGPAEQEAETTLLAAAQPAEAGALPAASGEGAADAPSAARLAKRSLGGEGIRTGGRLPADDDAAITITLAMDAPDAGAQSAGQAAFQFQQLPPQDQAVPPAGNDVLADDLFLAQVDAASASMPAQAAIIPPPRQEGPEAPEGGESLPEHAAEADGGGQPERNGLAATGAEAARQPVPLEIPMTGESISEGSGRSLREPAARQEHDQPEPLFAISDLRVREPGEDARETSDEGRSAGRTPGVHPEAPAGAAAAAEDAARQNILASSDQSAGATGSTFQQMLSQQIQQNAPEFVRAGSIVLRDNDQGTINLVMKPESLGNVKISLQVSDKVIAGQITVSSRDAYEAFRQNLETLRQAFQQSGFDSASFNLNLADNSGGSLFQQGQQQGDGQFTASRAYGDFARAADAGGAAADRGSASAYAGNGDYQIDVVA